MKTITVTLPQVFDAAEKSGKGLAEIDAEYKAWLSQKNKPKTDGSKCVPACGNGYICNEDLGECVPSVGFKITA